MRHEPHPLNRDEVGALLDACRDTYAGHRMRAFIALGYRCGLRCEEALSLHLGDLQRVPGGMKVRVRRPKGWARLKHPAPPRELGLNPKAQGILERWLDARGSADGYLLCKPDGTRISTAYIRAELPRLGRRAGLACRVHPHGLRHGFAVDLYTATTDIVRVSKALGHSNPTVTIAYLFRLGCNPELVEMTGGMDW